MPTAELIDGVTPYHHDAKAGIAIYHGDCREILPLIPDGVVDLVLTDPPYSHEHVDGGGFAAAARFYRDGALDGLNEFVLKDYWPYLEAVSPMLIAFCSRDLIADYAIASRDSSRKFDVHVWHKTNAVPFTNNTWKSDIEYIVLLWTRKPGWVQHAQHVHSKAWISTRNTDPLHPTAKPIPLLSKYISVLDPSCTLDPFAGSGTTLFAAKLQHCRAIGIELEERYCEIAARRLAQGVLEFA